MTDADAGRTGSSVRTNRPPPKLALGIGAACLAANHLSVVLDDKLEAVALILGCALLLLGLWSLLAAASFDAVVSWTDRSVGRQWGIGLLYCGVALGAAEAVAWLCYGRHLFG